MEKGQVTVTGKLGSKGGVESNGAVRRQQAVLNRDARIRDSATQLANLEVAGANRKGR